MNDNLHREVLDAARWHCSKLQVLLEAHMSLPQTSRDWEWRQRKLREAIQTASVRLNRLRGASAD